MKLGRRRILQLIALLALLVAGLAIYTQCIALNAGGANPLGGVASNAGAAVIGTR